MKIGLYFGSFNPIHIGHLLVATHLREAANLDEIWFVVSPQNPFKTKNELADEQHRLKMVQVAIENNAHFKVSDIEFTLEKPSYTHQTLKTFITQYPTYQFSLIIGEDNVAKFNEWKEVDWILKNVYVLVYNRTNDLKSQRNIKMKYYELPLMDISSTEIRKRIQENKSIRYFVPETVEQYIKFHNLYL